MHKKLWEKTGLSANDLLNIARAYADLPGTCLLFSGGHFATSQKSFLFLNPKHIIRLQGPYKSNPWDLLKSKMTLSSQEFPEWVGFLSYEMGAFSDNEVQHPYYPSGMPEVYFQQSETVLIYNHTTLVLTCYSETPFELIRNSKSTSDIQYKLSKNFDSEETYISKVDQAKELIFNGDIYQVNLSQQIVMKGEGDPFDIFCHAMKLNPAPFAAYIKQTDFTIVSTSPERFLSKNRNQLETRPIKGTAPRGKTPSQDEQNRQHLLHSPKETAELLMITDLMRNDLGKVSKPGSVHTLDLGILETFTNVFHKHAWIVSEALPELTSLDIVRSCFPGGSITGCPKIRAMQVITEIEKRPRGLYTGSIGYFCGNGDFDLNIAIRTMVFQNDTVDIRLGGGIVADSDPLKEYQETLHKGETIFKALSVSNM